MLDKCSRVCKDWKKVIKISMRKIMNKEIDQAFVSNNVKSMVTKTFSLAFNNLEIEAVSSKYVLLVNGMNDITSSILV